MMKILNKLKLLNRQYQTRKELRHLPTHLLNDIALTAEANVKELKKNKIVTFLVFSLRDLIKGN
jgi:uncharacterized protein YjiS (DUF1127 family)